MAPHPDHEGLQAIPPQHEPLYADHQGLNYVPYSDKVAVPPPSAEKQAFLTIDRDNAPEHVSRRPDSKRYCGMKKWVAILVMILAMVIVGLAVGVGAGLGISQKSDNESTQSSDTSSITSVAALTSSPSTSDASTTQSATRTSTSSASATPTSGMGSYNCPAQNNTLYTSNITRDVTYRILCSADQPVGVAGIDGGTVEDLNSGLVATSIEACIDLCVGAEIGGSTCTAVTYSANITTALDRGGITGNCFLKNQRAEEFMVAENDEYNRGAISAYQL